MLFLWQISYNSQTLQKQDTGSFRGRYFSCSVKSNDNLNTDNFFISVFMSWIFPLIWLSSGFNCLDAAQLIIHAGRKQREENQESHGELQRLLQPHWQTQRRETGISFLLILLANASLCTFLSSSQGQSFWSCPALGECQQWGLCSPCLLLGQRGWWEKVRALPG